MEQYVISGGRRLAGEVAIAGAKNAALGIIAAALMTDEQVTIENLPDVLDINVLLDALAEIGAIVDRVDRHTVRIVGRVQTTTVDIESMRKMRGSYYLLGALLGYEQMEEKWKKNLELSDVIMEMADDLCKWIQMSDKSSLDDPEWRKKYYR